MQNVLSPMVNMYQSQLEASRRFADAIFAGTEKIDRVVIGATHRAFNEQLKFAQAMSSIRDPRNVGTTFQSSFFSRNPDDTMNYQKEIMRIFAEMQNEIGRSMQDYIQQLGANTPANAAAPLAMTQAQANDAVFNPMTSMFSVWESAFKEVAELAKKNMVAARSAIDSAATKAREGAETLATATGTGVRDMAATVADTTAGTANTMAKSAVIVTDENAGIEEKRGPTTTGPTPVGGGKRK
ncbi:MAG: phasin family protein [Bacillota bacterium]